MSRKKRLNLLRETISQKRIDAFLVNKDVNVEYLSGFTGGEGFLLLTPDENDICTDFRYWEQVVTETGKQAIKLENDSLEYLGKYLNKRGIKRLGFESEHLSYNRYLRLRKAVYPIRLSGFDKAVEEIRMIKDSEEIETIRHACRIIKDSIDEIFPIIEKDRPTEKEAARILEQIIKQKGADCLSFKTIMASGKSSSMPHAKTTDKKIGPGIILIDAGVVIQKYCSDLTRTRFLGTMSPQYIKVWEIVKKAQDKAISKIKPGVQILEIDKAARDWIEKQGYGPNFGHALGHGVGLEVHEKPSVNCNNKMKLKEGMVFTIEPGIYIEGWGGIRIEDVVAVTKNGCEILTN